jgi:dipeptidyl aminopeptidase/acylaminoacyl peptidase
LSSTGGDVYIVPLHGGRAVNLTPNATSSATGLAWSKRDPGWLVRVWLHGAESGLAGNDSADAPTFTHSEGQTSFSPGAVPLTLAAADTLAVIQQDFSHPPEIVVGTVDGPWRALTHANSGIAAATNARAISWQNDGFTVNGWLLEPLAPRGGKQPMITVVHGGPSAAYRPQFVGRGTVRSLLRAGYAVFEPNPRGSFGAGEAFTRANVRDFGYGDLRDILTGIDAVEKIAPIDEHRLGVTGYSYGGYMTMWTVTQTHRFAAAVAGAGISDWLSYTARTASIAG